MITYSSQLVQYSCSGCVGLHYLTTYTDKKLKQIRGETHGVASDDTKIISVLPMQFPKWVNLLGRNKISGIKSPSNI